MNGDNLISLIIATIFFIFGIKTFQYWKQGYGFNPWGLRIPWGPFKPANKFQQSLTLWFSIVFCAAGLAVIIYSFF